ncbi:hypothetical protein [Achromobacter xylosoxidans]|uniref:hypothetical protein n=1 Tax=Alcaligenes xylosoxydans xylosoxydans TaxID=85698 RepID=UPI0011787E94|nr:hypothetical protein [Achromobacter xylosoxidans]
MISAYEQPLEGGALEKQAAGALHPISLRPLIENICVFSVFGFVMAFVVGIGSSLAWDTGKMESMAMEPLSVYSFSILSVSGFLGLILANATVAKTAVEMHTSRWVRYLFLPVINAGLSTGAIIIGMASGLAAGMLAYTLIDPQAWMVAKVFIGIALLVLAILYPVTWLGRSMFDKSDQDRKISSWAGTAYCVTMSVALWCMSSVAFWTFVAIAVAMSILFCLIFKYLKRRVARAAS